MATSTRSTRGHGLPTCRGVVDKGVAALSQSGGPVPILGEGEPRRGYTPNVGTRTLLGAARHKYRSLQSRGECARRPRGHQLITKQMRHHLPEWHARHLQRRGHSVQFTETQSNARRSSDGPLCDEGLWHDIPVRPCAHDQEQTCHPELQGRVAGLRTKACHLDICIFGCYCAAT